MPGIQPNSQRSNGAGSYLANENTAADAWTSDLHSTAGDGSELSEPFLNAIKNGRGVLLFEAKSPTNESFELIITEKATNKEVTRISRALPVAMDDVEKMFWHANIRAAAEGSAVPPMVEAQWEEFKESRKDCWFIFCHGYSVSESQARGWNAEVFKRLHQMGSDAKFLGVTWLGNQGQINGHVPLLGGSTPDYWSNVFNAFKSSTALAQVVNGLGSEPKVIAAHSLGNMLVSSAICDHNLQAASYFLLNAAVPREAYSATHVGDDFTAMRRPNWASIPRPLWAAEYWQLFANSDGRHTLTWQGRFGNLTEKTDPHNYYSSTEDVLHSSDGSLPNVVDITIRSQLAWVKQEMEKGNAAKKLFTGLTEANGGWKKNSYWDGRSFPDPANNNDKAELIANPYFKPFSQFLDSNGQNSVSIHGPNGSAIAVQYPIQSFLLANDVPALTNPAGSNEVAGFSVIPKDTNTNMSTDLRDGNWGAWEHSDLKNQPLDHVWKLFVNIVSKGNLKKN